MIFHSTTVNHHKRPPLGRIYLLFFKAPSRVANPRDGDVKRWIQGGLWRMVRWNGLNSRIHVFPILPKILIRGLGHMIHNSWQFSMVYVIYGILFSWLSCNGLSLCGVGLWWDFGMGILIPKGNNTIKSLGKNSKGAAKAPHIWGRHITLCTFLSLNCFSSSMSYTQNIKL